MVVCQNFPNFPETIFQINAQNSLFALRDLQFLNICKYMFIFKGRSSADLQTGFNQFANKQKNYYYYISYQFHLILAL